MENVEVASENGLSETKRKTKVLGVMWKFSVHRVISFVDTPRNIDTVLLLYILLSLDTAKA